jgi:type IV pilus assembly protein PilB
MSTTEIASSLRPESPVLALLDAGQARRYQAVPIRREGRALVVAMSDPGDLARVEELEFLTGSHVRPLPADPDDLGRAIERHYPVSELPVRARWSGREPADSPVVDLQRAVLSEAVRLGASDIHLDPGDPSGRVRFRVDGHLTDGFGLPRWLHPRLVARMKVIARMDISEHRVPQDGHLADAHAGYEARLSTIPTPQGEALVLRLFGVRSGLPRLSGIGCSPSVVSQLRAISHRPQGVLLVTGPTGSGKTTTLYAILDELRRRPLNIVTIEDPIEYRVPGLRQVQVDERVGLTFRSALRATLRQDPDVILVGEIRDPETARIAFDAGLTGHLVLSTLHATGTAATLVRLAELGIDQGVVASALLGVVAQRLVRLNCPRCRVPDQPPEYCMERMSLGESERLSLKRSEGCAACGYSGTHGRRAFLEVQETNRTAGAPLASQARQAVLAGEVRAEDAYHTFDFGASIRGVTP